MATKVSNECQQPSSSKHRRIDGKAEGEAKSIKITDLDDYCLEQIFNYLDFHDLLNIALANTILQHTARVVFKQKFGNDVEITFYRYNLTCKIKSNKIDETQHIKFLISIFGDFISSIEFMYLEYTSMLWVDSQKELEQKYADKKTITKAILKHSFESLVRIELINISSKEWLSEFSRSLPKVESITLRGCVLSDRTMLLPEIFPKLNHLNVVCYWKTKLNQIIAHFPYLKKLELSCASQENQIPDFLPVLKLNPQITSCVLANFQGSIDWKLVPFIIENMNLEKLKLISGNSPNQHFHFKILKHFVYSGDGNSFPFTFDQLEKLKFRVNNALINSVDGIIKQNGKLKKLSLHINRSFYGFIRHSKELSKLSVITFNMQIESLHWADWKDDINALGEFVNKKSFASKIKIKFDGNICKGYEEYLQAIIDTNKWQLDHEELIMESKLYHPIYVEKIRRFILTLRKHK